MKDHSNVSSAPSLPVSGDPNADPKAPSRIPQWLRMVPVPRRHWTPRYIVDRLRLAFYQRKHPEHPWLTADIIVFLSGFLNDSQTLVEFGSGRSTVWFAKRVGHIISCEHHGEWHASVMQQLKSEGRGNFTYLHVGGEPDTYIAPATRAIAERAADGKADVILVDGIHRDHCALWALEHIRPGGMILVDNINWFLPHETRSPASVGAHGQPHTELWAKFWSVVRHWEMKWTSNGVTDTAAFFAPRT